MATQAYTRRAVVLSAGAGLMSLALAACTGDGSSGGAAGGVSKLPANPAEKSSGVKLVLQSHDTGPLETAVKAALSKYTANNVTLNTIPAANFKAQLPSYLSGANPPDIYTWFGGSTMRGLAKSGRLLDLTSVWQTPTLSPVPDRFKQLVSYEGKQWLVPTHYYWWSLLYRKSLFKKWGVEPAKTWDEFMVLCKTLKQKGITPIANGSNATSTFMVVPWFDNLDLLVNGREFHLDLLAGKHSFDSPQVKNVLKYYAELLSYIDPNQGSYSGQQASGFVFGGKAAMILTGSNDVNLAAADVIDDVDFFPVPIIDSSLPRAIEAPTDGYIASSKTKYPAACKSLIGYLGTPAAQELYVRAAGPGELPVLKAQSFNLSPLQQAGSDLIANTPGLTQFFNRDSSDALQNVAITALQKFIHDPNDAGSIVKGWQSASVTAREA